MIHFRNRKLYVIDRRPDGLFAIVHFARRTTGRAILRHTISPAVDGSGATLHSLVVGARFALVMLWQRG